MAREINRRDFIKMSLATAGGGILTWYSYGSLIKLLKENIPYGGLSPQESLKTTAEAVRSSGIDNSFVPEALYTKDVFEYIRSGTYIIDVRYEDEILSGTAWCAKREGNFLYFATSSHGMHDNENNTYPTNIDFWRPNIDAVKKIPLTWQAAITQNRDLSLIKCEFNPSDIQDVSPLAYRDNFSITAGQKALMMGFPGAFRTNEDNQKTLTLGSVVTMSNDVDYNGTWKAWGINSFGSSGSPIAFVDTNGHPFVAGIVIGVGDVIKNEAPLRYRKQPEVIGTTLFIDYLIKRINEQ